MGTRGYVWAYYASDDGNTYSLLVDADYAAAAERGWVAPAAAGTPVYPRGWKPRYVTGLDATGRTRRAVVATIAADLWTGAAATFTIEGTDEAAHVCTVVRTHRERMQARPR